MNNLYQDRIAMFRRNLDNRLKAMSEKSDILDETSELLALVKNRHAELRSALQYFRDQSEDWWDREPDLQGRLKKAFRAFDDYIEGYNRQSDALKGVELKKKSEFRRAELFCGSVRLLLEAQKGKEEM